MTEQYTKDQLIRFIVDAINRRTPDNEDQRAAAKALMDVLAGTDLKKEIGLTRKRGQRGPVINPDRVAVDDSLFGIVCAMVRGDLGREEGENLFADECENRTGKALDDKTIKKYIDAIWPRAVQNAALGDAIGQIVRDARKQSRKKDD